jgi:hypothetical protein
MQNPEFHPLPAEPARGSRSRSNCLPDGVSPFANDAPAPWSLIETEPESDGSTARSGELARGR